MGIELATWNIAGGLNDERRSAVILDEIEKIGADVLVINEVQRSSRELADLDVVRKLGYTPFLVEYGDAEPHPSGEQYLAVLSRLPDARCDLVRLGTRNALRMPVTIEGERVDITGAHFDDRNDETRIVMAEAFIDGISPENPNIFAGDMNNMHADDVRARMLANGVFRWFASKIPDKRIRSLATRSSYMAEGGALAVLEDNGFSDADPRHQATMKLGGFAVLNLDHIMHDERIAIENFQVLDVKGSDHNAIRGTIKLAS